MVSDAVPKPVELTDRVLFGDVWEHLIGVVALLFVGLATLAVPSYVALILVGASLTILALLNL